MIKSGLLNKASLILRFGFINDGGNATSQRVKQEIENDVRALTNASSSIEIQYFNASNYECDSIRTLKNWCIDNKDAFTFYVHNKGMSLVDAGIGYQYVSQWRAYMMFYLFERWKLCANSLMNGAKACGVNRRSWPEHHYSGNFWWARCDHVTENEVGCLLGKNHRFDAEYWIIKSDPKPVVTLWDNKSKRPYREPHPREMYSCVDILDVNSTLKYGSNSTTHLIN